jgi:vitamin B12 transporter
MFRSRPIAVLLLGAVSTSALPSFAAAAATTTPSIVVTATRTPVDVSRIAASTTVITRGDIQAMQVHSVPELLNGIAGLDVVQNGGPGKATSFFLRGTESDHVLVLINGIRVGSVSLGTAALEQLPLEHIDRIEIVRGPRASQWGPDAIGGVIQIFTRSGEDLSSGQTRYDVGAGAGSYNTYDTRASVAGATDTSNYQASVEYFDTAGFNARQPVPGPYGFYQPDKDGYRNLSVHVRGGHRFSDDLDMDAFVLHAEGTTEFDGTFQDKTDFIQQVLGTEAHWQATDSTSLVARAGESRDEQDSFAPDGAFASRFDSKRDDLSLLANMEPLAGQVVNFGVDYLNDKLDSSDNFTRSSRDDTGVFAEYLGAFGEHNLTASLRHDDNEATGGNTTGGLGWSVNLPAAIKLYASYATAFKTPTFNELYFPGFGNPNLSPETSKSVELGIEGKPLWGSWSVRGYRTTIKDLIATVLDPVTQIASPENIDSARIDGLEAEVRTMLGGFDVDAALTVMDPRDRNTGNLLPRRPGTSVSVDANRSFDRLRVGGRVIAQGYRYDDAANTVRVGGFATVDLTAQYELRPGLYLRGRIGNLFDKSYETAATFNTAGRNVFVSMVYRNSP